MIPAAYSGIYPRHTPPPAERLAILPPEPPAAPTLPPPADADGLAAHAATHAADCLDQLADLREATIEAVLRRADGGLLECGGELSIGLTVARALGALLALSRHTSALGAETWAAIVALGIEGPEQDRELAETLRTWASARPTDPAPPSEVGP